MRDKRNPKLLKNFEKQNEKIYWKKNSFPQPNQKGGKFSHRDFPGCFMIKRGEITITIYHWRYSIVYEEAKSCTLSHISQQEKNVSVTIDRVK